MIYTYSSTFRQRYNAWKYRRVWTWNPLLWILEGIMTLHVGTRRYYRFDLVNKLKNDLKWGSKVWYARILCPMGCQNYMKFIWSSDAHVAMTCRCGKASMQLPTERLIREFVK